MAYTYQDIMRAQSERIDAEAASAAADLEAARLSRDEYTVHDAASRILQLDAQRMALAARANQYIAGQQAANPPGNKYRLSQDELDVAHGSFSDLPKEERERIYFENKQKYQTMRATGQYRDDQGTVRR
jgi:hypothetical protein